ncbi:MAG: hypothetical protein IPL59_21135 [Candidatus Competibacteraceae bacterium]|uniref:Uncharacterized protein n=1 Tax=Candidatus Contendobacter odensis Run_B_J11 TaxID=1400861 RepID=A0A7U7J2V1_9GAMM|nr:hypothetical protein [Candidatus Contendobacter odensis]MBK8537387.1 hypothetical protein [Candidatus Competibacteraceae bacterium]CDH43872.1 hypothetical protein BN874_1380007 [Candidatus Contendobacter odensis Run_B_J11]
MSAATGQDARSTLPYRASSRFSTTSLRGSAREQRSPPPDPLFDVFDPVIIYGCGQAAENVDRVFDSLQ